MAHVAPGVGRWFACWFLLNTIRNFLSPGPTSQSGTNPLSHTQSVSCVELAGAVLLPGQAYMRLSPGQCWLRGHAWQRPESPSQKPARQTQSLAYLEPGGEVEWSLHTVALPSSMVPPQK